MKPSLAGGALAIVLLIALVVASSTLFSVYQTRQAWSCGSASQCG
jgi:cell division protein FtsL